MTMLGLREQCSRYHLVQQQWFLYLEHARVQLGTLNEEIASMEEENAPLRSSVEKRDVGREERDREHAAEIGALKAQHGQELETYRLKIAEITAANKEAARNDEATT